MIIKTKKYKLENNLYIKLCLKSILHQRLWFIFGFIFFSSFIILISFYWFILCIFLGIFLYFLFWFIQFYGITKLDQNQLIFEKLSYQIDNKQIVVWFNNKQGMPILWNKIKCVFKGSDYFLLYVSKTHIIHLPYKIFNNDYEIKIMKTFLIRKNLLTNYYF